MQMNQSLLILITTSFILPIIKLDYSQTARPEHSLFHSFPCLLRGSVPGQQLQCGQMNHIQSNKAMQKTKLISKDLIRDCRVGRERRENTIYSMPLPEEEPQLLIPDCHSLLLRNNSYSIDFFILNLQADQFLYYNDQPQDAQETRLAPNTPSIQQINHQYFQRIAQHPPKETVPKAEQRRVSFGSELFVKYFREENAPSEIGESEEHGYVMEEQDGSGCLIQEGF